MNAVEPGGAHTARLCLQWYKIFCFEIAPPEIRFKMRRRQALSFAVVLVAVLIGIGFFKLRQFIQPEDLELFFDGNEEIFINASQSGAKTIRDFFLSEWGKYYALEQDKITEWDANGNLIGEIGSTGQGPGEFTMILGMQLTKDKILINDQGRKIIIYSKDGEFLTQFPLEAFLASNFAANNDDGIIGVTLLSTESGKIGQVSALDRQGRIKYILQGPKDHGLWTLRFSKEGGVVGGVINPENLPAFIICPSRNGVWIAHNLQYVINFYDYSGNLVRTINGPPISRGTNLETSSQRTRNGVNRGNPAPLFNELLLDESNRLYVVTISRKERKQKVYEADIYSEEGNYLLSVKFPAKPKLISNGFIYFISEDQEGWPVIKRIKVKNYPEIFAGRTRKIQ